MFRGRYRGMYDGFCLGIAYNFGAYDPGILYFVIFVMFWAITSSLIEEFERVENNEQS